jgi:uncharacterized membrane protein
MEEGVVVKGMNNRILRLSSIVLSALGTLDAAYLTYVKLANARIICGQYSGCETVNSSIYSEVAGIPVALLGAGVYLLILIFLLLEGQGDFWRSNSPLFVFGLTLVGVLFSAYLTYLELAVIHAACIYCVTSAILITILFIIAILRLVNPQAETNPI